MKGRDPGGWNALTHFAKTNTSNPPSLLLVLIQRRHQDPVASPIRAATPPPPSVVSSSLLAAHSCCPTPAPPTPPRADRGIEIPPTNYRVSSLRHCDWRSPAEDDSRVPQASWTTVVISELGLFWAANSPTTHDVFFYCAKPYCFV